MDEKIADKSMCFGKFHIPFYFYVFKRGFSIKTKKPTLQAISYAQTVGYLQSHSMWFTHFRQSCDRCHVIIYFFKNQVFTTNSAHFPNAFPISFPVSGRKKPMRSAFPQTTWASKSFSITQRPLPPPELSARISQGSLSGSCRVFRN